MADTKISALTAATVVSDTDELPLVQSGSSKRVTVGRLNRKVTNKSVANQSPGAATSTLLTGSTLAIPAGVTIGTTTLFQWKLVLSKTAAGTAANTFYIRAGTTGTVSDTAIHTFSTGVGTAVVDTGRIDVMMSVRTTGASGTSVAALTLTHSLASTGLLTVPSQTVTSSGTHDTTIANLIFSMSSTSGASTLLTFSQVVAEVVNV